MSHLVRVHPSYSASEPAVIKATPAAAQKCPPRFRLATAAEAPAYKDWFVIQQYGGQHVEVGYMDWHFGVANISLSDGFLTAVDMALLIGESRGHSFPNTGCQKSWCKLCGEVGHWDWRTQQFQAKE